MVNPFIAAEGSDNAIAQPITYETMRRAKAYASNLNIELLAVTFEDELSAVPKGFRALRPLDRSVLDLHEFFEQALPPLVA